MSSLRPYNSNVPTELSTASEHYVREAFSANTLRGYKSQLAQWSTWATANGAVPSPANPTAVAAWLSDRARAGSSRATIGVAMAAICWAHQMRGERFDADHPVLTAVLKGIRRAADTARSQRQARPLTAKLLRHVLSANTETLHQCRDAAVAALLYSFGLRRSELVELDFQRQGRGLGVFAIGGDRARVTLLRSKSAQTEAEIVEIERDNNPRAFAAIEAWILKGQIALGTPLVRGIDPAGTVSDRPLHANRVSHAVKAAVTRYYIAEGTEPSKASEIADQFSGHSGRIGLVVSAVEAGASDTSVMSITRHKSPAMVARYGKQARQRLASPHRLKGVGV
ncbi:MAG: tyrosine-type recombinase/integrase [Hyphomicrobiaceae bacterium]|nr:tyrosine-type recombinase/integrase [Hyphomicrobiaceae bacterium]